MFNEGSFVNRIPASGVHQGGLFAARDDIIVNVSQVTAIPEPAASVPLLGFAGLVTMFVVPCAKRRKKKSGHPFIL